MLVQVLKPFSYSVDGRRTVMLEPGEEPVEIRDDLCAGLSAEGYIDGQPHGLPLLSDGRRRALIDTVLEAGRAELAKLSDQDLIEVAARYQAKPAAAAVEAPVEPAHETKVIEGAPETGAPEPLAAGEASPPAADAPPAAAKPPPAEQAKPTRRAKAKPAAAAA